MDRADHDEVIRKRVYELLDSAAQAVTTEDAIARAESATQDTAHGEAKSAIRGAGRVPVDGIQPAEHLPRAGHARVLTRAAVVLVLVATAGLIFAFRLHGTTRTPTAGQAAGAAVAHDAVSPRTGLSIALPGGFTPGQFIAADPTAPGFWTLSESNSEAEVFWVNESGQVTGYPLGDPTEHDFVFAAQAAIAVAPDGTVWAGAGTTLAELTPRTGAVKWIALPSPTDNPTTETHRPPAIQGSHAVTALAVSPAGVVAVAMSGGQSVVTYDPTTSSFGQIKLPTGDEPLSVTFLANGTLGIVANNWETKSNYLDVATAGAVRSRVSVNAWSVSASPSGFLAVTATAVETLAPSANGTSISTSSQALSFPSGPPQLGRTFSLASDGRTVVSTTAGFALVNPETGSVQALNLPSSVCGGGAESGAESFSETAGATATTYICPTSPGPFILDHDNDIWYVGGTGATQFSELPASQTGL